MLYQSDLSANSRYCPTHRTGWNWELPKFIKKIKTPDYKGESCGAEELFVRIIFAKS